MTSMEKVSEASSFQVRVYFSNKFKPIPNHFFLGPSTYGLIFFLKHILFLVGKQGAHAMSGQPAGIASLLLPWRSQESN